MKQTVVFERDYTAIKEGLEKLKGSQITVSEYKTKNKTIIKKGI